MLTTSQRYGIATRLACSDLITTIAALTAWGQTLVSIGDDDVSKEAIAFARRINVHYRRRDGFVPSRVQALCR